MDSLIIPLKYYGISPWEIEVIYGLFKDRFQVKQEEVEQIESEFVSMLDVPIPLAFNEEFFKWFDYRRWEKVKAIFKEMKRRRGSGNALKINVIFSGSPKIRFVLDAADSQWFNNSVEKIDFLLELLPYHLDPEKLPNNVTEIIYHYVPEAARWRLNSALVKEKKFIFINNEWKIVT